MLWKNKLVGSYVRKEKKSINFFLTRMNVLIKTSLIFLEYILITAAWRQFIKHRVKIHRIYYIFFFLKCIEYACVLLIKIQSLT